MINIINGTKTITTAGTPERLVASETKVATVVIQALGGDNANGSKNTGKIKIGKSDVSFVRGVILGIPTAGATAPSFTLESSKGINEINLFEIWVDSGINGEGVSFFGVQV